MRFSDVIGNAEVKAALVRMAVAGRIPHAMMFYENEGCGALALIVAFMQYLNCKHRGEEDSCGTCPACNQISKLIYPDMHFVFPTASKDKSSEKPSSLTYIQKWRELFVRNPFFMENELYESLGIDKKSSVIPVLDAQIILNELSLSSYSDGYRAVVIWLPEKLKVETANKLLKIIEEPSERTLFFMVTHQPERVLQTIRSRCQLIRVKPAAKEEIAAALPRWTGVDAEAAGAAAEFAGGSIGVAIRSLAERDENVEMMDVFMRLMDGILARDFQDVLETGDVIAAMASREKQKAFCKFAGDCIRKIYMIQKGLPSLAGLRPEYKEFFSEAAAKLGPDFCRRAILAINKANAMVVRNVNQKILFTNMVDRLFVS